MNLFAVTALAALLPASAMSSSSSEYLIPSGRTARRTAVGDFYEFNELFENAEIVLPDTFEINQRVGLAKLDMTITNLKCYDMSVGDIAISHVRTSDRNIDVLVNVYELDLKCEMDYDYSYGILNGDGWVRISTDNNSAFTKLGFQSQDFDKLPPTSSAAVEECIADVEISNLNFEDDPASEIIEIFQGLVKGLIERELGKVACDELGSLGTTLVENMIDLAQEKLEPYRGSLSDDLTDPLHLERNFDMPSSLTPLNFQEEGNSITGLFNQALAAADAFLGTPISDSSGATSSGRDLAINIFLRDYFLGEDRAFTLTADQIPLQSAVVFEGHDRLTETTMTLNQVRVLGLDTMTRFNPFMDVGRHTLQNEFTWDQLTVEFDLTVDIKPSTLEDAILKDPTSNGISERIKVDFGVDNVDVVASLLLVMDQEAFGALELGSLMETKQFLPCLLSVIHEVKLAGIGMDPQEVNEPTLTGFISPGIDRIVTDSVEAAFAMYTGVLRESIPSIFQTTLRDFINEKVIDVYMSDTGKTSCTNIEPLPGTLDFRQFFDTDMSPYGDIPPMLKNLLDSELLSTNPDTGTPRINDVLIAPYTKQQSGEEGNLEFPGEVFGLTREDAREFGLNSIELRAFDPTIKNLDSFTEPLDLLNPNATNGYVLDNVVSLASGPDSLYFSLRGLFAMGGDPALELRNEMELSVNLEGSQLFAAIMAEVDNEALLTFPLRDIMRTECWLSALATPSLTGDGSDTGLSLESILLSIPSIRFGLECTNCTSPGLSVLPDLLSAFEEQGVSDVLDDRLVDLGLDLVRSDFVQAHVNRMLVDGSLRCPHSAAYVSSDATSEYPVPSFPSLPYRSIETVAFASTMLLHIATAVIAESHKSYNPEEADPLSGQSKLVIAPDARIVDFSALEDSIGEWADVGVNEVVDYLSALVDDENGPDGRDLRINSLLRSSLLDDHGMVDIKFENNISFGGEDTMIALKHVRITGVDTITSFDVLDVIGPQTLRNQLRWDTLGLEVVIALRGSGDVGPGEQPGRSLQTTEEITLSLELSDIDVSLALLLAMDLDKLGALQLSSMLDINNILPCIISAAQEAELTELQVSVGSINDLSVNGFRSDDLSLAASESSRIILEQYGETIISSMPGLFDVTVRALLNNWVAFNMDQWTGTACPTSKLSGLADALSFIDFRDLFWPAAKSRLLGGSGTSPYGNLFQTLHTVVHDLVVGVDSSTGLSSLNSALISPWTRSQSDEAGSLVFPGELMEGGTRVQVGGLDATIQLRASDARIHNLDTIGSPLALLESIMNESYLLNNTATFGAGDRPLRFGFRFLISLLGDDDMQIKNDLDISVDLSTASVILKTMLKVAEQRFFNFPLRDLLDYNCWLAMIPAPALDAQGVRLDGISPTAALAEVAASVTRLNLNVSCLECSSPRMSELTELLSTPKAQEDATEVANMLLDYVTELVGGNFLQIQIDRWLNDAARKCPHSPVYKGDAVAAEYEPFEAPDNDYSTTYLVLLGSVTMALILLVSLVVFVIRCIVRRRHRRWLGRLPAHQIRRLVRQQNKEKHVESQLNEATKSMFQSPEIPRIVRWSMPLIILCNIAFFLSGHLSLGATVNIDAELAGEELRVEKFFEFSMAKSTVDIWNAGGRELAIMILIFSGIWPYTKQLMTLCLWFLPPSSLSVSRRGSILLWLDWLAKWSMIDIFVLVISIAAFRVSIASPDVSFLPKNFYSIDMMVVPLWGLYANMIAQLISQVSSHFIIHYHRRVVHAAKGTNQLGHPIEAPSRAHRALSEKVVSQVSIDDSLAGGRPLDYVEKKSLGKHTFGRPHRGETEKLVVRGGVNPALCFLALLLAVFVIVGCSIPSFSLEILGLIGLAVESGQGFEDATTNHSVFTVLKLLVEEARFLDTFGDYVGLGTLSVVMLVSVLLVPILQCFSLLRQWFTPYTGKQRERWSIFIEILQAWQYAEVYLLAVFVASWQFGPVSEFMINSYCDSLKDTFGQAVYYGILKKEDAQCFSVQSSIEGGSFMLAAGSVLLALINTLVTKAVIQYFRDRNDDEKRIIQDEEQSRVSDETFDSEEEQNADIGFSATIHPVPVLFTDSFRWILRRDNSLVSSSRAIFAGHGLPEATAIPCDDDFDRDTIEGHYVSEEVVPSSMNQSARSKAESTISKSAYHRGKRLTYDDEDDMYPTRSLRSSSSGTEARSLSGSSRQESGSIGSSTRMDEPSFAGATEVQSLASSVRTPTFEETLTDLNDALTVEEILHENGLEEDEYSEAITNDVESEYVEETVDDFEEYTVNTMSDIAEEEYYEEEELSMAESRSGRHSVV